MLRWRGSTDSIRVITSVSSSIFVSVRSTIWRFKENQETPDSADEETSARPYPRLPSLPWFSTDWGLRPH
eukprot:8829594-Pyramimonas_sp.AAC.1